MRSKSIFLYVDAQFDVPKRKIIMKTSSAKCSPSYFCGWHKMKFWLEFRSFFKESSDDYNVNIMIPQ